MRDISSDSDINSAKTALREVMSDASAPAAARVQAARTLLEMGGAIGKHQSPPEDEETKDLATLTRADLLAELTKVKRSRRTDTK